MGWGTTHLQELDAEFVVGFANLIPPEMWWLVTTATQTDVVVFSAFLGSFFFKKIVHCIPA